MLICLWCVCDCGAWWCSIMPFTTTTTRGNGGQSLCAHQNLTPHLQPLPLLLLLLTHTASVPHPLCPPCLANHPHTSSTITHHTHHTPPLHRSTNVLHQSTINTPTVRSLSFLRCLQVHGRKCNGRHLGAQRRFAYHRRNLKEKSTESRW